MNIILLGAQGSGKGVIAQMIEKRDGLKQFSTGDALRAEITRDTAFREEVENAINSGKLVSDEIINNIIEKHILKDNTNNVIFDGYPRNIGQAEFLDKIIKIDAVIELVVTEKLALDRLATRIICPECKKIYNIKTIRPVIEGICDVCQIELIQRTDDQPKEIKKRLAAYNKNIKPILEFYKKKGIFYSIDGSGTVLEEYERVAEIIRNMK